jgi:DTW domain-containing protein YfiP
VSRCPVCRLAARDCLCAEVPRVLARTRVLVLRHALERWKPSNSARLAALALPASCEIVEHGLPGAAPSWERLEVSGTYLLYPGGATGRPPDVRQLVVLDGSWPQTRRMAQRIPALRRLPRLSLPAPAGPVERMRRPPRAGHLATLEAIARALELLEGPEVAHPLDRLFAEAVRRSRSNGWHGS